MCSQGKSAAACNRGLGFPILIETMCVRDSEHWDSKDAFRIGAVLSC